MRRLSLLFFCFGLLIFCWLVMPTDFSLADTSATGTVEVTATVPIYVPPSVPPQVGGALPLYDSTPPLLFNLQIIRLTPTEADIYWETNEPATGFVQYGKTVLYEKGVAVGEVYVWKHFVYLKNLDPETLYHFRIRSGDSFGNEAVSLDQTFTTPKTPDLQPPLINFLRFENIKERSAEAVWQTDEPSRAELTLYVRGEVTPPLLIFQDKEYAVNHRLLLDGLKPATLYQVKLQTFDPAGNLSEMAGSFKTLIDKTPPANPANFSALSGDQVIYLSWRNPPDPDFDRVVLVYRLDRLPKNARDGQVIYQGKETRFIHSNLKNGQFYYYGLFAFDEVGNSSSGSLLQARPQAPLGPPPPPVPPVVPPLPTIPVTPPISIPLVTVPKEMRLSPFDFKVWAGRGRILLKLGPAGEVEVLPAQALRLTLSRAKVSEEDLDDLIGVYDGSAYRFYKGEQDYLLDLPAPIPTEGELEIIVILSYKNKQNDVISFKIKLHPLGKIYEIERVGNGFKPFPNPLAGAEVSLLDTKKNLWPGADFGQKNPVLTDAAGHYGFMVPNGPYHLRVWRPGFLSYFSPSFEVKNNIVAQDIRLFRLPLTICERLEKTKNVLILWWEKPGVKLGLLLLLLLLLLWLFFWRKRRKEEEEEKKQTNKNNNPSEKDKDVV